VTTDDEQTNIVLDDARTVLAFRTWRCDLRRLVLHSLHGGVSRRAAHWMLSTAFATPEQDWPQDDILVAKCGRNVHHEQGPPDASCSCGIYGTDSLEVVNDYLTRESPVLGLVELGGRTIPAAQGFRSLAARVAAVLLVDEVLTLPHWQLRQLADAYKVPALRPESIDPQEFRQALALPDTNVDWDGALRKLSEGQG
jgi:hypothetical protein